MGRLQSRRRAYSSARTLRLQQLEERRLLATITWSNPSGGSWLQASNWDLNRLPTAGDDVVIPDLAGTQTITIGSGSATVDSIVTQETLSLASGSDLTVSGTIQGAGALEMRGGQLRDATVNGNLTLTNAGGTLNSIAVSAAGTVDGRPLNQSFPQNTNTVTVVGGLVLDGSMLLGKSDATTSAQVKFQGSQTLSGTGTVTFGDSGSNALLASGGGTSTLTIASGVSIQGGGGKISGAGTFAAAESIINNATVNVDGQLTIGGTNWVNNGTIIANGAQVFLDGTFTTAALGNFQATGATVNLTGTLINTGDTFTLSAAKGGNWFFRGGGIQGGTVSSSDGSKLMLTNDNGTLDGVTIDATTIIDGTLINADFPMPDNKLTVLNGLTLDGTMLLGKSDATTNGQVRFQGSQTLGGTGTVTFGGSVNNALLSSGGGTSTLTIGPGVLVNGNSGKISGAGTFAAAENMINTGTINVTGNLTLGGAGWSNTGSVTANGANVSLAGSFTTAALGNFTATGGTVSLTGTVINTGDTLTLQASKGGNWFMRGGTIQNGTVSSADGSKLMLTNDDGTLDGVIIDATTIIDGTLLNADFPMPDNKLTVLNGLTLGGTMLLGKSDATTNGQVRFQGSQTLSGTGTVTFGGSVNNALLSSGGGTSTLTIGPGILVNGNSGRIKDAGTFAAAENMINTGNINVTGNLTLGGAGWSNTGSVTANGANVSLAGSFTTAALGNFTATGATVSVTGTLINSADTLILQASKGGNWFMRGGTIQNGTVSSADGSKLMLTNDNGTLDGVTIDATTTIDGTLLNADFPMNSNTLTVLNGLTLEGTMLLGKSDGTTHALARFQGSQALSGSGTVTFGSAVENALLASGGGTSTLTIGPSILINGLSGRVDANGTFAAAENVINNGTINVTQNLKFGGAGWVNSGSITANGATVTLAGSFVTASLGTFSAVGGTVNLTGTLQNAASTFTLQASHGNWRMNGGTIQGGTITTTDGTSLFFSNGGGVLDAVTVAAGVTIDGTTLNPAFPINSNSLTVRNGLLLDGTMLLGKNDGSTNAQVRFEGSQTLSGSGTVTFGSDTNNGLLASGGGTSTLTIGPNILINGFSGSIAANGTFSAAENVINQGTINVSSYLRFGGAGWLNSGSITAVAANVTLIGSFTHAAVGNFSAPGSMVFIAGTMDNTGNTLTLRANRGTWALNGGQITGGTITTNDGSSLWLTSGGVLDGVTVTSSVTIDGTHPYQFFTLALTVRNGLIFDGTLLLGSDNGSVSATATFEGTQGLTGTGKVRFGSSSSNRLYARGSGVVTLTIGSGIFIEGGRGTIGGYGTFNADETVVHLGQTKVTGAGILTFSEDILANAPALVSVSTASTLVLNQGSSLLGSVQNPTLFAPRGKISFSGGGTVGSPQRLEVMGQDLGSVTAGFTNNNFAYGTLALSGNTYVKLVDLSDNIAGGTPEALYTNSLIVPFGSTLDLAGLKLYARASQIDGTIVNGSISQIADSGAVNLGSVVPGNIQSIGELDEWTFFGRVGNSIQIVVNPSSTATATVPAAFSPQLQYAQVELVAPDNSVLATANGTTFGQVLTLSNVLLPVDGIYRIRVRAATGQSSRTGNYNLAVHNIVVDQFNLVLNQRNFGQIAPSFNTDRWSFSLAAGSQIRFDLHTVSAGGLQFTLQGPGGYEPFTNISADSDLITIPAGKGGVYTLIVQASFDQTASYSFTLQNLIVTDLPANTVHAGILTDSGDAQLFRVTTTVENPLLVQLDDSNNSNRNEIYMKLGAPPTRADFDYRYSRTVTADPSLLAPHLPPGQWYILVYGNDVTGPSNYTLRIDSSKVQVVSVSPSQQSTGTAVPLEILGAGFLPGSQVALIAADTSVHLAQSVVINAVDRLTAIFDLTGLPQGDYDVRVTLPDSTTTTLPQGFEVLPPGQANLETQLILPGALGRHAAATLYVEYANTGTESMPAPILTLQSYDPNDRPLLTLDQSLVVNGFWSSNGVPEGFSNTVQIYASGAVPGLLLPGERIRVPVYYIGVEQPWDFGNSALELEIRIHAAGSTDPMNWAAMESELRPDWATVDAWTAIYANLQAQVGPTWGDYVQMLSENAEYLNRLGSNQLTLNDLYEFEVRQANGFSPIPQLVSVIDAEIPTIGLPLTFGRSFGNTICSRYKLGLFGYGWSTSWSMALSVTPEGTVVVSDGVAQRRFQPDSRNNGHYLSDPTDTGQLRKLGDGTYELTEKSGLVTKFRADGKLDYVEDHAGNRITASYTGSDLTLLTHSSGGSLTLAYNNGRIVSITDSNGDATTYSYDVSFTHLLSVTGPGGTTTYTYSEGNGITREHALLSATDPSGVTRNFEYDTRGRLTASYLDTNTQRVTFSYNETGKITVTDATNTSVVQYFDAHGNLLRVEDSAGNYSRYEYNQAGQLVRETDSFGRTREYVWCSCGSLVSFTDELGNTTSFTLGGPNNRPMVLTDALGNLLQYEYDSDGNRIATVYSDGSQEQISYDLSGNPDTLTNRRGEVIDVAFNAAGQITQKMLADGTTIDYTYDSHDRLRTVTDPGGTTTYTYDTADRLTRIDYPNGRWLEYTYDAAGRRTRLEDYSGFAVAYTYDTVGRLIEMRDENSALIVAYQYDAAGRLSREDKGNGTYTTYAYNAIGDIANIVHYAPGGGVNSRFDYSYDILGRRTEMVTLDGTWTYTYDVTGQLTRAVFASTNVNIPDQDLSYEYDAVGNRIRTIENGTTTDYTVNSLNQYVTTQATAQTTTYQYDLDGNLIQETGPGGTRTYTYNSINQLIQVVTPDGTWQYEYDAFGNRQAMIKDGVRTEYLLDPLSLSGVLAEFDGSGNRLVSFANGLGLEAAVGSTDWVYYDFDGLGSTSGLTSTAGGYVNQYAYDPFGGTLFSNEAVTNEYQFVGEFGVITDGNDLQFMKSRFYSPELGRFLTQDQRRSSDGHANFYEYAGNEPISPARPTGTSEISLGWLYNSGPINGIVPGCGSVGTQWVADVLFGFELSGACAVHDVCLSLCGLTKADYDRVFSTLIAEQNRSFSVSIAELYWMGVYYGGGDAYVHAQIAANCHKPDDAKLPLPDGVPGDQGDTGIVQSIDPNEKYGAAGYGPEAFITPQTTIPYRIEFENLGPGSDPTPNQPATAPAQRVEVTDQLSNLLDWETLSFNEFGFGDNQFTVPAGRQYYFATVPMTFNNVHFDVQVELSFDIKNGLVRAVFQSIDPKSQLPPDILTGFLPPEDGTGRGMGYISFSITPVAGLGTGTEIRNVALISFDGQTIIATNQVDPEDPTQGTDPDREALNTIDAGAPNSSVGTLPEISTKTSVNVSWSGSDDVNGSGLESYTILVSDNGGPYSVWLSDTTETEGTFDGERGHTYRFYSIARDNVGYVESAPVAADAQVMISLQPRQPEDINDDGVTDVVDALLLINELLLNGVRDLSEPLTDAPYWDVDDNGSLDVVDAVIVINYLLNNASQAPPEAPVVNGKFTPDLALDSTGAFDSDLDWDLLSIAIASEELQSQKIKKPEVV